jgi:hypothetical protein
MGPADQLKLETEKSAARLLPEPEEMDGPGRRRGKETAMRQFGSRMYLRMRSQPLPALVVQPLHTAASDPQGDLPSSVQLDKPDRAK